MGGKERGDAAAGAMPLLYLTVRAQPRGGPSEKECFRIRSHTSIAEGKKGKKEDGKGGKLHQGGTSMKDEKPRTA